MVDCFLLPLPLFLGGSFGAASGWLRCRQGYNLWLYFAPSTCLVLCLQVRSYQILRIVLYPKIVILTLLCVSMHLSYTSCSPILSFGEDLDLLHDFGQPFTEEAGAKIVDGFAFEQQRTNTAHTLEGVVSLLEVNSHGCTLVPDWRRVQKGLG